MAEEEKASCRNSRQGGGGLHSPSIFSFRELLNWELELERVSKALQVQLHLDREDRLNMAG